MRIVLSSWGSPSDPTLHWMIYLILFFYYLIGDIIGLGILNILLSIFSGRETVSNYSVCPPPSSSHCLCPALCFGGWALWPESLSLLSTGFWLFQPVGVTGPSWRIGQGGGLGAGRGASVSSSFPPAWVVAVPLPRLSFYSAVPTAIGLQEYYFLSLPSGIRAPSASPCC